MVKEIGVQYLIVRDKDKSLDPAMRDSHKIGNVEMTIEEEVIDVKIIAEMIVETEGDKTLEVLVMTEADQGKEA